MSDSFEDCTLESLHYHPAILSRRLPGVVMYISKLVFLSTSRLSKCVFN